MANAAADGQQDYLFYALPSSRTAGGLCWLETQASNASSASNEPGPVPPRFVTAPPSHHVLDIVAENVIPFVRDLLHIVEWHVIWNPYAGRGIAKVWLEKLVIPLLTFAGVSFTVHESVLPTADGVEDGRLYQEIFGPQVDQQIVVKLNVKVIIMGGDGTTSDYLNRVVRYDSVSGEPFVPNSELIVIPLGTANALFFSTHPSAAGALNHPRVVLTGLLMALFSTTTSPSTSKDLPRPLPLALVRLWNSDRQIIHQTVAHVVASTALHASILHTADDLRDSAEFRGSDRFQEGFRRNNTRLWDATLQLLPVLTQDTIGTSGSVWRYDCGAENLIEVPEPQGIFMIEGGFSYFASCLIDRLEASFMIAPMRSGSNPDNTRSIDVIVVRPQRDRTLQGLEKDELGKASAAQITEVMGAAYQSGSHLQLKLQDGQPVVEYFRCGGWRWVPACIGQEVCIDGKLVTIPAQGAVECTIINDNAYCILLW